MVPFTDEETARIRSTLSTVTLTRDDVAAVAVVSGCIGGCVLLGLAVGWLDGLGLFFGLLAVWGVMTLRALSPDSHLAAERDQLET